MKKSIIAVLAVCFLACAGIGEKKRLDLFEDTAETYRRTLLSGDFAGAALFIDSGGEPTNKDFQKYQMLKITNYNIVRVDILENPHRIAQNVNLEYFLLNVNRLKNVKYLQVWLYDEVRKIWLLQTDLPQFD